MVVEQNFSQSFWRRNHLGDKDTEGRTILKLIKEKYYVLIWIGRV